MVTKIKIRINGILIFLKRIAHLNRYNGEKDHRLIVQLYETQQNGVDKIWIIWNLIPEVEKLACDI